MGRKPFPAAFAVATEAEPEVKFIGHIRGPAPRLPRIVGTVQPPAARAPLLLRCSGQLPIDTSEENTSN